MLEILHTVFAVIGFVAAIALVVWAAIAVLVRLVFKTDNRAATVNVTVHGDSQALAQGVGSEIVTAIKRYEDGAK